MAGGLGGLLITLGLDTVDFDTGLTKSEHEMKRFADNVNRVAKQAAQLLAGIGIAAGTMAAAFVKSTIDTAAGLDDMAEKTGASVEELSKLQQQARISGESLETIEAGLVKLAKALHGSDEEAQGAGKALAALGLKAEDLKNLDTAEALRIVAGELNKYEDGAGKTALALDLFGKSGAALLPILKDMAREGKLNASITTEQAAQAEELQKTLRRLTNQWEIAKQQIALEFVPTMQTLLSLFVETNKETKSLTLSLAAMVKVGVGNAFGDDTATQIRKVTEELGRLNDKSLIWNKVRPSFMTGMRESDLLSQLAVLNARQRQEWETTYGRDNMDPSFGGGIAKQRLPYGSGNKTGSAKKVIDEAEKDRKEQIALAGRMLKADAEAMKYYADEIKKIDDAALKDREEQIRQSGKMIKADADAQLYFRGEIEKFAKESAEANKVAAEQTSSFWDEAFRNMQRSASDFIFDTMQGNFSDFGTRFKQTVDRMVADWIAAQAMMAATSFIGKRLGGANDFGAFTNIIGGVANWISGTQDPAPVSDLTPRAGGGPVYPGQDYLVGERGAEIFRPRTAGMIIPNRGATEGDRNVSIQVIAPNPDGFRQTMPQLAAQARNAFF